MGKASKAKVDEAFTAGFEDKEIDLSAELDQTTPAADLAAVTSDDLEIKPGDELNPGAGDEINKDEADPWDGVPAAIRARFETQDAKLVKVTNIANSASGRANKLQGLLDRQANEAPLEKPVVTSDQLLNAMTNKDKRDELREEFGEFAAALDEIDQGVSMSVGTAIDKLKVEMRAEAKAINSEAMAQLEIKRTLDIKHPGWETTVKDDKFKDWAYEGGPSKKESDYYDSLLYQASLVAPDDSAASYGTANKYFESMKDNHPVWAEEKGNLWGDSSSESAISLLDLYKVAKTPADPATSELEEKENLFEANITPTSGQQRQRAPASSTDEVNKAFIEGFEN
tara:strand:+ start:6205 stop:7227 length:1023 start_codon:yes stop_codon:yes gene_type:complete